MVAQRLGIQEATNTKGPAPTIEELAASNKLLSAILKEHQGHGTFTDDCRLCIYSAAYSIQHATKKEGQARAYLSQIKITLVNSAIIEVSQAFEDDESVRPFVAEIVG